ncbi:MAG: hypothetical protein FWE85_02100 [Clostridiales bacterium]|nr:hypothetical protein [Clostridiales bacterium]
MDDYSGLIIFVIMISVAVVNFFVSNLRKKQEAEARRVLPPANRPQQPVYPASGPFAPPARPVVQPAQPKRKPAPAPPKAEIRPAPSFAAKEKESPPAAKPNPAFPLNMDQQSVRSGIIMAEILGKPKALRRR